MYSYWLNSGINSEKIRINLILLIMPKNSRHKPHMKKNSEKYKVNVILIYTKIKDYKLGFDSRKFWYINILLELEEAP